MSTSHEIFVKEFKVASCIVKCKSWLKCYRETEQWPLIFYNFYIYNNIYRIYVYTYTHIYSPVSKAQCIYACQSFISSSNWMQVTSNCAKSLDRSSAQAGKHLYSISTGKAVKSKSLKSITFSVTTLLPQDKASSKYLKNKQSLCATWYKVSVVTWIISKQYPGKLSRCLEKKCVYNTSRYAEQPVESPESFLTVFLFLSDIFIRIFLYISTFVTEVHHINDNNKVSVSRSPSHLPILH